MEIWGILKKLLESVSLGGDGESDCLAALQFFGGPLFLQTFCHNLWTMRTLLDRLLGRGDARQAHRFFVDCDVHRTPVALLPHGYDDCGTASPT